MSNSNEGKVEYYPEYRIYKPKKTKDGSASKFQIKVTQQKFGPETNLFLQSSHQTGEDAQGNSTFAWKDEKRCVTMKLGETDIGELLSVLNGQKGGCGTKDDKGMWKGLFHQNDRGSTVLQFSALPPREEGGVHSYGLRISAKRKDADKPVMVQHMISVSEGEILKVLLQDTVSRMYRWRG